MNRTLLLIICDFLLLNLLALTRWEKAEPPREAAVTAAQRAAAAAPQVNADMVELMRVSLEDERRTREAMAQRLASTQGTLEQREQNLAALAAQKGQLETALGATQANVRALEQRYSAAAQESALTKEQLAALQRELEAQRAELERQRQAAAALERQNAEARQRIENLNVAVRVAEQEKQLIAQNLTDARRQVEVERAERAKVQEQTTQLVQGVGQLAEQSGALTQEIRDHRPVNPNVIFTDFLANRVQVMLSAQRPGLFSPTVRDRVAQTVLVTDGRQVFALMHVTDTPFSLTSDPAPTFERISGRLSRGGTSLDLGQVGFLALDPRVVVVPVDDRVALQLGAKIYRLAAEPFKFPEAVLVRAEDGKYGETPFRIDAQNPGYVKVDNRVVTRLFGEFSPKRGDLMFSKSGDLIGIMANNDFCVVLGSFEAAHMLRVGAEVSQAGTGAVLADLAARWSRLPYRLQ